METTNQQKTSELFGESAKIANKWFSDATSSMLEIYNKQLNMAFGFYNNLFNSVSGNANRGTALAFPNLFSNGNGDSKSFFNPLSWMKGENGAANPFNGIYQNFIKQITDYNRNWLNTLQGSFHLQQNDLTLINEKYRNLMEKEWETIKNTLNAISKSYNAQLESSIEMNKKISNEWHKLISNFMRSSEEFWTEIAKTYQASAKTDKVRKPENKEVFETAE